MLERFTDAARHAIASAGETAREAGADEVTPLHLLGGLTTDVGRVGDALGDAGVTGEVVLEAARGRSRRRVPGTRRIAFTPEASLVIEGSLRVSRGRGAARIDTFDLLVALLERPGEEVAGVLAAAGADPGSIRRALLSGDG